MGSRAHEHALLGLQRRAGNRATSDLVSLRRMIQRAPNDRQPAPAKGAPFAPKPFYEGFDTGGGLLTEPVKSTPAPKPITRATPSRPTKSQNQLEQIVGATDMYGP